MWIVKDFYYFFLTVGNYRICQNLPASQVFWSLGPTASSSFSLTTLIVLDCVCDIVTFLQKYPNHLRESFDQYQRSLQWISSPDWTTNHKKCITQGKEVKFASSLLWRGWIAFPDQMVMIKIFKECELLPFFVKCLLHVFKYGILSI